MFRIACWFIRFHWLCWAVSWNMICMNFVNQQTGCCCTLGTHVDVENIWTYMPSCLQIQTYGAWSCVGRQFFRHNGLRLLENWIDSLWAMPICKLKLWLIQVSTMWWVMINETCCVSTFRGVCLCFCFMNRVRTHGRCLLLNFAFVELQILARFSPLLLSGIEEDLVHLLKDDNEIIREGVLHVLANAGGTIREQLGVSSRWNYWNCLLLLLNSLCILSSYFIIILCLNCSSLDLILERICLEGSRREAKYAVHALAAITKDDGLMSLSVLYKVSFNIIICHCKSYILSGNSLLQRWYGFFRWHFLHKKMCRDLWTCWRKRHICLLYFNLWVA